MPVTVFEMRSGRRNGLKVAGRQYGLRGATSETEALAALLGAVGSTVPATLDGKPAVLPEFNVEELDKDVFVGNSVYRAEDGTYQAAGSFSIQFDISGQTQRIYQSYGTISRHKATGQPDRNFHGAINVTSDLSSVEGVDVLVPNFTFTLNYTVDPDLITDSYVAAIAAVVGKQNSDTFKEFAAGELLLVRVTGSRRDSEAWDISFGFAVARNATGLTVGTMTGIDKLGWDYLWVFYRDVKETDGTGKSFQTKLPVNAYVERIYPATAYSALGIP